MDPINNAILGLVFLAAGVGSTFLMYHLWGYPFDHETHTSAAPRPLMLLHRVLGYVYFGIYIYFMTQMVPRMWNYQIEFPARTVAHLILGMSIGTILIIKIAVVRFFKHLESSLVPALGTALMVCTVLLIGLSVPFALRDSFLWASAPTVGGRVLGEDNRRRVRILLEQAGVEEETRREQLSSVDSLDSGRQVLTGKCVQCHDLRTVMAQPRTPQAWRQTVTRMAERSSVLNPITEQEQWQVTAYLIAISPDLQKSLRVKRHQQEETEAAKEAASHLPSEPGPQAYDAARARELFESKCSLCHELAQVENATLTSEEHVRETITRMVSYGLTASEEELALIVRYVTDQYVK